jgi:hypothetical protein
MRRALHRNLALLLPALLVLAAGCTLSRAVSIESEPSGATIFVNGEERGVTPATVSLHFADETQRVIIQIVKEGYRPAYQPWYLIEVPEKAKKFALNPE